MFVKWQHISVHPRPSPMAVAAAEASAPTTHPGRRMDDARWQVSWLAGLCAASAFPVSQWHDEAALAAYSCGGSRGLGEFSKPRSLLAPYGEPARERFLCARVNSHKCFDKRLNWQL